MATGNIYVKLSKLLQGKESILKKLLISTWLGGFVLIIFLSKLTGNPEFIVGVGGRLWFTACVIIGVLYMVVTGFNPDRDPVNKSAKESWAVFILNIAIVITAFVWFIEG